MWRTGVHRGGAWETTYVVMPNSTEGVGGATGERTNRPAAAYGEGGEMRSDDARCTKKDHYDVGRYEK